MPFQPYLANMRCRKWALLVLQLAPLVEWTLHAWYTRLCQVFIAQIVSILQDSLVTTVVVAGFRTPYHRLA